MVASPRLGKKENVFAPDASGEKLPKLLKVAAIYGPNASGKSSLLAALDFVGRIARQRTKLGENTITAQPFRFDPALQNKPSIFEYHFVQKGTRYQYTVAASPTRITAEELISYPQGIETLLFDRTLTDEGEKYTFGKGLEGGGLIHEIWRKLTSPRSLFLVQAGVNSSEDMAQLQIPLSWFINSCMVIDQNELQGWSHATRKVLAMNPGSTTALIDFLGEFDIPVSDISISSLDEDDSPPSDLADVKLQEFTKISKTTLTHTSALGSATFDFSEESEGTKNLIGFWIPWFLMGSGRHSANPTFIIDELDSSLHPKIVVDIISKHIQKTTNAQLIFTTHDTHLMNSKVLRRDQFWITERDKNAATRLFSIHDFKGREGEDIESRYFAGRYRGLPLTRGG